MKTSKIILILLILLISISLLAQANPFTGKSSSGTGSSALQKSSLWHTIAQWQKEMNSKLTTLLKGLGDSFNLTYFLILIAISAAFGVIHAIGPGIVRDSAGMALEAGSSAARVRSLPDGSPRSAVPGA